MMSVLYDIKEKYEKELKKIADKPELSPTDLEATYKIVDILKDIETISAMNDYGEDDMADDWSGRSSYRRGRKWGRHNSDKVMDNLYKAMDSADSEDQRMAIMNIINRMK